MIRGGVLILIGGFQCIAAQNTGIIPPLKAQTRIVQVPVTVIDANGNTIEGLAARDFVLRSDGIAQPFTVDTFDAGAAKISLVVAVQTSGISMPALGKISRIGGMIQPLVIGDSRSSRSSPPKSGRE